MGDEHQSQNFCVCLYVKEWVDIGAYVHMVCMHQWASRRPLHACSLCSCIPLQRLYADVHASVFDLCAAGGHAPYAHAYSCIYASLRHTVCMLISVWLWGMWACTMHLAVSTCQCACISVVHYSLAEKVDDPWSQNTCALSKDTRHMSRPACIKGPPLWMLCANLAFTVVSFIISGGHTLSLEPCMTAHSVQMLCML